MPPVGRGLSWPTGCSSLEGGSESKKTSIPSPYRGPWSQRPRLFGLVLCSARSRTGCGEVGWSFAAGCAVSPACPAAREAPSLSSISTRKVWTDMPEDAFSIFSPILYIAAHQVRFLNLLKRKASFLERAEIGMGSSKRRQHCLFPPPHTRTG